MNDCCLVDNIPNSALLAIIVVFSLTVACLLIRLHRVREKTHKTIDAPDMPAEIKEATTEMAKQVSELRKGLRRIARSDNPMEALVKAISRDGNGNEDDEHGEPVR